MDKKDAKVIQEYRQNRAACLRKLANILCRVGVEYIRRNLASLEIHSGDDIHAFYRLSQSPDRVVHVRGYPGMSSSEKMRVWARQMDYGKMVQLRAEGASIGDEHDAVTKAFNNFEFGVDIPYDAKVLEEMLAKNVPELAISH